MEIKLKEFVKQVVTEGKNANILEFLIKTLVGMSGYEGTSRLLLRREVDYVRLVLPAQNPASLASELDPFLEKCDISYFLEDQALVLNFYKVSSLGHVSSVVVRQDDFHSLSMSVVRDLFTEVHRVTDVYTQLEAFYSAMEKFMFLVEGLKNYRLMDVERFLRDQLNQVMELEKFAIYINDAEDPDHFRLLAAAPNEVEARMEKNITLAYLERVTDYYITEMEMANIQGYLLYRPKAYSNIEEDFLYLVNYVISKAIENSILFEEKRFLAERDPLTDIYNRRYFFEALDNAIYNAQRYDQHLSLIIFDIDDFKKVNDTYGHMVGDIVLKRIGKVFKLSKRQTDIAGRYGGEEFVLMCNAAGIEECRVVAERIRKSISEIDFSDVVDGDFRVTISAGAASFDSIRDMEGNPRDNLIKWADKGLYKAKATGKNRVVICEELKKTEKRVLSAKS